MKINVYSPEQQGTGSFDDGKIMEQKPIAFPHEYSAVRRVGPLFYWAWGFVKEEGALGLHPHNGFEIMTYVINGRAEHGDTLGTISVVNSGGVQVMQAGSGLSHQERVIGPDAEAFQIWFEPHLGEAFKRKPTYNQYGHEDFPVTKKDGLEIKTLIGEGSPVQLVSDVQMWDIDLKPGSEYKYSLPTGYSNAALAIRGGGTWQSADEPTGTVDQLHKDFVVLEADSQEKIRLLANKETGLRILMIQVPTKVNYPLYNK